MSAENKKILWIAIAVVAFVLVLAGAGLFLFAPRKGGAQAPASINNTSAPKAADPQDYLSIPPTAQTAPSDTHAPDGNVIVIYGNKPGNLAPAGGEASPALDTSALAAGATQAAKGGPAPAAAAAPTGQAAANGAGGAARTAAPTTGAKAAGKPAAAKTTTPSTGARNAATPAASAQKPTDHYWIQAASFASRGKADDLKSSLAKKGIAALITVADVNGKSWYRVRIGPYAGSDEANGWLLKIKEIPGCEESGIWKTRR
jgi:DedD protein